MSNFLMNFNSPYHLALAGRNFKRYSSQNAVIGNDKFYPVVVRCVIPQTWDSVNFGVWVKGLPIVEIELGDGRHVAGMTSNRTH
jgi:hypothetical protein